MSATVLRLADGVVLEDLGADAVLWSEPRRELTHLDAAGRAVLLPLLAGGTPEETAQILAREHGVDPCVVGTDIDITLERLLAAGLVVAASREESP